MITPRIGETEWLPLLQALPALQVPQGNLLVVAPHPDDETLGAGGLIASCAGRQDCTVQVVAVTDGENAYADHVGLGPHREREQTDALACLGVSSDHILRLRMPDSGLAPLEQELADALRPLAGRSTHILAPWQHDYHPDHEVCGRAAALAAAQTGAALTYYFFWTWHRGALQDLHDLKLVSFSLDAGQQAAKWKALQCHRSQLDRGAANDPILPASLLTPARRNFEVFLPA